MRWSFPAVIISCITVSCTNVKEPAPYGVVPTPQQVEWQKMEYNMFMHFGPNTFTGVEWGTGQEKEDRKLIGNMNQEHVKEDLKHIHCRPI